MNDRNKEMNERINNVGLITDQKHE